MENSGIDRPVEVKGKTIRVVTGCGKSYITVSIDPDYPAEVFGVLGKTGACPRAMMEAITRLVTIAKLAKVPNATIIKALKGIRCPNDSDYLSSCPNAVALALETIGETEVKSDD